ncbi:MAG: hypothetical protein E7256_01300 [Lachnospiraceae bacterium]|nr:hypothetical protein [Lachnospiraceae bacterium]
MSLEKIVLCVSSAYDRKFYISEKFTGLPQAIKDELQIMCVMYTEEVGGELTLAFDEEGELLFHVSCDEEDLLFDEIGSVLKIKDMQNKKKELLESLEMYYKVFYLKQDASAFLDEE